MTDKLILANEVAGRLNVSTDRIYQMSRVGLLPHVKLGRQIRFDLEAIDEFIKGGGKALSGGWRYEK